MSWPPSPGMGLNSCKNWAPKAQVRLADGTYLVEEVLEPLGVFGMAELAQGLGFDLANALTGHPELATDLLECPAAAVLKSKSHREDGAFPLREREQHIIDLLLEHLAGGGIGRRQRLLILNEIAEVAVF